MGLGDDIMWRAEAYHEWKKTGKRQRPYKKKKKRYTPIEKRDIWIESPWISNRGDAFEENTNNIFKIFACEAPSIFNFYILEI